MANTLIKLNATSRACNFFRSKAQLTFSHMPLISTLGNPGMKDLHWKQVSEIIGFPFKKSADTTLEKVIDYGLAEYVNKFESISESATKKNNLEKGMQKMINEWGYITSR
jgi:dynein heavy chain, axonemal